MRNIILGFALVFLPILLFLITNKFEIFMFWEYKPLSFIFDAVYGYISLVSIVCGFYYFPNKNFRLSSPIILLTAAYFSISILMSNLSGSAAVFFKIVVTLCLNIKLHLLPLLLVLYLGLGSRAQLPHNFSRL